MRDVAGCIAAGRAACSEDEQITDREIQKLYADAAGDMFALIVSTFYFGFAAGCKKHDRKS